MDKIKLLENLLVVRLLSGDMANFMTELLQLNITPSEAKTMDPFGDPSIGEMVAVVLENQDDAASNQEAISALRDYVSKVSTVGTKSEPKTAPAEATGDATPADVKSDLESQIDGAKVNLEEAKTEEPKEVKNEDDMKILFSQMSDMVKAGFDTINARIDEMTSLLNEVKVDDKVVVSDNEGKDIEVLDPAKDAVNFSAENETKLKEDKEMKESEFELLRDRVMSRRSEGKNFDEGAEHEEHEDVKDAKDESVEEKKDDFKEFLADVLKAAKELRDALLEEDKPAEKVEEKIDEVENPAKDEGLTADEIEAIESDSKNFSAGGKISVMNYLYGDK